MSMTIRSEHRLQERSTSDSSEVIWGN